jgi:hypothetical protein
MDSDKVSRSVNELNSASSPQKKFYRAVRRKSRLCCSTFNAECGEGSIRDLLGYCLSLGTCSLASYELEKLTQEHFDPIPDTNSAVRPVGTCDAVDGKNKADSDRLETVLLVLEIFLFSIQKIGISYNCIGSDLAITNAVKHFLDTFLRYLHSTKEISSSHATAIVVSSSVSVVLTATVMVTVLTNTSCD